MINLPFQEDKVNIDNDKSINILELGHREGSKHGAKQPTYDIPEIHPDSLDVKITKEDDNRIVISVTTNDKLLIRVNIDPTLLGQVLDIQQPSSASFNTSKHGSYSSRTGRSNQQGQRRKKKPRRQPGTDTEEHNPTTKRKTKKKRKPKPDAMAKTPKRSNRSTSSFEEWNQMVSNIPLNSSSTLPEARKDNANGTDSVQAQASPQIPSRSPKQSLSPRRRPRKDMVLSDSSISISEISNFMEDELRVRQNKRRGSLRSVHHGEAPTFSRRGTLQEFLDQSGTGGETAIDGESVAGRSMASARPIRQRRLQQQQQQLQRTASIRTRSVRNVSSADRTSDAPQLDDCMYQSLPAISTPPMTAASNLPRNTRPTTIVDDDMEEPTNPKPMTITERARLRRQRSRRFNNNNAFVDEYDSTTADEAARQEREQRERRRQRRERRRQQRQAYQWAQENQAVLEQVAAENTRKTTSLSALWGKACNTKWIGRITNKLQSWGSKTRLLVRGDANHGTNMAADHSLSGHSLD